MRHRELAYQIAEQFAALSINSNDYLRSVLVKALGEERASSLLEDILETRGTASGMETLNFMEPQAAADLIRDEHPSRVCRAQAWRRSVGTIRSQKDSPVVRRPLPSLPSPFSFALEYSQPWTRLCT